MMTITLLFFFGIQSVQAQTEVPKIEIGGHYSYLSLGSFGLSFGSSATPRTDDFMQAERGAGGRVTFNLTTRIAVEGEINFFRNSRKLSIPSGIFFSEYSKEPGIQGLFGPKIGIRTKRVGLFGKVRPGFLRYTSKARFDGPTNVPAPVLRFEYRDTAGFALDLGGVVEFYPSRHTVFRFDIGDTMIRYKQEFFNLDGTPRGTPSNNFTNHNLQFNVGFGLRF